MHFMSFPESDLIYERKGGEGEAMVRAPGNRVEKRIGNGHWRQFH